MKDFESLASLTPERILEIVHLARDLPHYTWRELVPGDHVMNVGKINMSPNEKYYRLLAGQPLDECLNRAAIRNLRMHIAGIQLAKPEQTRFLESMPEIPTSLINEFRELDSAGKFQT